ncbi:extracellular solute-binding protein [Microbacterium radiodurans]|uniref:Extracellular solute-binding protein n=1 Tax=Microbacterium radiodurans TaxID=661398 RepID=A0A5J5ISL0_9MICO|nr:extracellular solute-binding protein [Microbacterium radiodurans]KAA9086868.1 extracellular solute-binding protein [Microbacterium radiodurans]
MTRNSSLRTGAAVLGVALLLGLPACAGADPGGAGSEDDGQPLEVWSRSGPEAARTYQAVFDAFTRETGIQVEYLATVEFETQLQARAAARDLPDVLIYDQSSMAHYVDEGMLLPVDRGAIAGADELSEDSWRSVQMADGDYYGVPFSQHAQVTFIRKDWREKLGFEVPETHDELLALATAFATQDPDGNGVADTFGMAVPGTTDRGFFAWWSAPYLWQRGGEIVSGEDGPYTAAIADDDSVAAVEWLQDVICTPSMVQPGALTNASATPFFAEGKAGIYQTGPYAFANFDNTPGADAYEVITAPAGPGGSTTLQERTSIYFGASTDKHDKQHALAEFLISTAGQELGMTAPGQPVVRLPVNEGIDAVAVYGDDRWAVVQEQLEDSRLFPSDIDFTVVRQDIAESFNSSFGQCSADAASLRALADRMDEELAAQGTGR